MPAAIGIRAGKVLVPEHLHCLNFRQGTIRAPLLHVDIVTALWAFKNDSICEAHYSIITPLCLSRGSFSLYIS
jgi:hypothetical protein